MAREQVKDLPGRGVRPANIRGGTVGVVVQQAEEPAIMGLARSLNGVNKALQNYHSMGATVSEMEEKRIMSMTPEERAEELNKTKAKLDGAERKGLIPFLGNPLNWERNKKALAVGLAGDLYDEMTSDTGRLKNPKQHDDTRSLDEIVQEEVGNFLEENPAIEGQQIVLDEFYRAFEGKRRAIQREYGDRQSKLVKGNIVREFANEIHALYEDLDLSNAGDKIAAQERLVDLWGDVAYLNNEQRVTAISNIAEALAVADPAAAYEFLDDAKNLLTVGNAAFGKMQQDTKLLESRMADIIEKEQQNQSREARRKRTERTEQDNFTATELKNIYQTGDTLIRDGSGYEFDNKEFNDVTAFREYFKDYVEREHKDSPGIFSPVREFVDHDYPERGADFTALMRVQQLSGVNNEIAQSRSEFRIMVADLGGTGQDADFPFDESTDSVKVVRKNYNTALNDLRINLEEQSMKVPGDTRDKANWLQAEFQKKLPELQREYKQILKNAYDKEERFIKTQEEAEAKIKKAADTGIPSPLNGKPLNRLKTAQSNMMVALVNPEKAPLALRHNHTGLSTDELTRIVDGEVPKRQALVVDGYDFSYSEAEVPYTDLEREQFRLHLRDRESLEFAFTSVDVLEQKILPLSGFEFDPKKLNVHMHFILTPDEAAMNKPNAAIKKKAELIGIDADQLLQAQKKAHEKYKHLLP